MQQYCGASSLLLLLVTVRPVGLARAGVRREARAARERAAEVRSMMLLAWVSLVKCSVEEV